MPLDVAQFESDVASRANVQRSEHPLLTRLVALRVALNHEFGREFQPYDHELAVIERTLVAILPACRHD